MYQAESIKTALATKRGTGAAVSSTAILLGITSMLTDISSEMVSAILPLYLVFNVGLSPLQFGAVDGVYQGASAFVRVLGGFASDRWNRHKEVAGFGYGLSAAARVGIIVAGASTGAITLVVLIDRIGKGIRTGPRDALITLTSTPERLGYAFGVHRALDTFGAMLGPLFAFGILMVLPGDFNVVFIISFLFAMLGVAVLTLFVKNARSMAESEKAATVKAALGLLREPKFRKLTIVAGLLALATISDAFVYLALQKRLDFAIGLLPLLYVGSAAVFTILAVPFGRLADRFGRMKMFYAGYALLPLVYTSMLIPTQGTFLVVAYLILLGSFYAATDGVLMAQAGPMLPDELKASGMSVITTATALSKLLASILFGALWTWLGLTFAVTTFGVALLVVLAVALLTLRKNNEVANA